jgi:hypothetical protein
MVIQHAVDLHLGVVAGNADLRFDIDRKFGQAMTIGDAIHERDDDTQAGLQCPVVFAEALDHPGILLRHDLDRPERQHGGKNPQHNDKYTHYFSPAWRLIG